MTTGTDGSSQAAPDAGAAVRSYAGRTAVVTGAGSGIGRALCLELGRLGADVALSDSRLEDAQQTAAAVRALGVRAEAYQVDVADRDAVFAHAAQVAEAFGAVHLVVNNAGVALHGDVEVLREQDMRWLMDINYWGVVHGSQAFLPLLADTGGQLANVSSVFGLVSIPGQAAYNAAKFAVRGFTEALRQECQLDGGKVSVSCIHPGGVRTAIARNARVNSDRERAELVGVFDKVARTSPEAAARVILRGLAKDRPRILVGPDAWLLAALPRFLGARYGQLTARGSRRLGL